MKTTNKASILLLGLGLFAAVGSVEADDLQGKAAVYPRDAIVFGATYSSWAASWQQWAASIPASEHPLFDKADCSKGQSGPVWFLGGKFCVAGDAACGAEPAVRSCTVPRGTALFFPVVNFGCLNGEAEMGYCGDKAVITVMRSVIGDTIGQTVALQVTLDGMPVKGELLKDFRVQSPVYTAVLPEGNLLQAIGETVAAGTYWGVDDGVYIMLPPLPPGDHTLNFKGTFPQFNFTVDFTYKLTVE